MRISDWSSDVCSSDLPVIGPKGAVVEASSRSSAELTKKMPLIADASLADAKQHPQKVVIVDDDLDILAYLNGELTTMFKVTAFSDGEAAYKHILTDAPDLIVSDVMMPVLDGLSLCSRSEEHTSELQSLMRLSYSV